MGDESDEEMHITLLSQYSPNHNSFILDKNGKTKHIEIQPLGESRDSSEGMQEQDHPVGNQEWEKKAAKISPVELRARVPPILTLKIRLGHDLSTKEYFEKEGGNVDNWLAKVMTHTQASFLHSSLEHQIILQVNYRQMYLNP